jgi:hypothetical protein
VVNDPLDETFRLEVGDCASSKRSVDLHSVDDGGGGDDSVGGDFLHDSVAVGLVRFLTKVAVSFNSLDGLVEDDGVVGLILNLSL